MTNIPTSEPGGFYKPGRPPRTGDRAHPGSVDAPHAVARVLQSSSVDESWSSLAYAYRRYLESTSMGREARRAYGARVSRYATFAATCTDGNIPPASLHADIVENFIRFLQTELELAESSINCTITTLRHFYLYLGIDISAIPKKIIASSGVNILNSDSINNLADVVSRRSERDQAIIHLFLLAGLRTRELVNLNVQDFSKDAQGMCTIRIVMGQSKGNRNLLLTPSFASVIEAYLQIRFGAFDDAIFVTKKGQRMTTTAINYVVRSIGWAARLELSPGILRDTFLYHQLSQRQSLKDVAYVGGYSRLSSLRRHIGIKARKEQA